MDSILSSSLFTRGQKISTQIKDLLRADKIPYLVIYHMPSLKKVEVLIFSNNIDNVAKVITKTLNNMATLQQSMDTTSAAIKALIQKIIPKGKNYGVINWEKLIPKNPMIKYYIGPKPNTKPGRILKIRHFTTENVYSVFICQPITSTQEFFEILTKYWTLY